MKLLSVNLARSIWLSPFFDLNPEGKSLYPLIPTLIELYKFKRFPSPADIPDFIKGIRFEDGEFMSKTRGLINLSLTIYSDGLVVDSRSSTEDLDLFLMEALTKVSKDFGLRHYEEVISEKKYISQLYVTTDKTLEIINPKLKEISGYLMESLSWPFEMGGISFWPEQTQKLNPPLFSFERAINSPFAEKRYYTTAGLPTNKHLELLDKLEEILSGS